MAAFTGSIAKGFPTGTATAAASIAVAQATTGAIAVDPTPADGIAAFVARAAAGWAPASTTASTMATTSSTTASTTAATRSSGAALDLHSVVAMASGGRSDLQGGLFVNLRSALAGLSSQTGFDQLVVSRLIAGD